MMARDRQRDGDREGARECVKCGIEKRQKQGKMTKRKKKEKHSPLFDMN